MSETPTRIGPYAIERRLGAGGMAETFVAVRRMQSIEQRVCLKRILPAYARDATARRLFSREANISAKLRHANLVQVLDVGEDNGTPYLVMELVEGSDLDHVLDLAPDRKLSPELVGYVLAEIAHGLHEAHGGDGAHEGVVHRDLSPSNVLLSTSGEVKVADFGIAKALSGDKATATMMRGKFAYMAPEQLDGAPLDPRADMFALGVIGFEMLAGVRPFDADADARLVLLIAKNERKSIHELAPSAPVELRDTIEALLSPQKEARPRNGHDVVERLAGMLPAAVVARRQLGKLVTAAFEARMAAAVHEPTPSDAALAATFMASGPTAPSTAPTAVPSGTPMVVGPIPETGRRDRPVAPVAASTPSSRTPLVVAGLGAVVVLALVLGGIASTGGFGSTPATTAIAPPTTIAPPTAVTIAAPATSVGAAPPTTAATPPPATEAPPPSTTIVEHPPTSTAPPPSATAHESEGTAHEGRGHLHVVVSPWGQVWIDDRIMGRAPIDADLRPGSHRIQAGFSAPTVTRTVRVRSGSDQHIELEVEQ
jgi:tRNA A-37 threonylcarbamoyl transferase component Bud32